MILMLIARRVPQSAPFFHFPRKITLPEKVSLHSTFQYTAEQDITSRATCLFTHFQANTDETGLYRKVKT